MMLISRLMEETTSRFLSITLPVVKTGPLSAVMVTISTPTRSSAVPQTVCSEDVMVPLLKLSALQSKTFEYFEINNRLD